MNIGFVEVISIIMIVYGLCEVVKTTKIDKKYLPAIAIISGAILGVVAYLIGVPDFPASDILTAIAIGMGNGLAATGVHQLGKQLFINKEGE